MRQFLFSVYDSCAVFYDRPFAARDDASAVRSFGDIAGDAEHPIGKHPEHYSLFRVGLFDDLTGEIVPEVVVCVGKAHELVAAARVISPGGLKAKLDSVTKLNGDPPLSSEEIVDVVGDFLQEKF